MRYTAFAASMFVASVALAGDTNVPGRVIIQTDDSAPTCSTASGDGTLCVEGATELQSTLAVAGATTLSGDIDVSANLLFAYTSGFTDKTSNYTVTTDDCGTVLSSNDDNRAFTLPGVAAANLGCVVTIVNTAADDAALMSVSPNASDGIYGTCCGVDDAATTSCTHLSGTDDKDAQNTKATQNKGDMITLVSDGSTGWYTLSCIGVWASES